MTSGPEIASAPPKRPLARRLENLGALSGFGNDVLGGSYADTGDLTQTFYDILMHRQRRRQSSIAIGYLSFYVLTTGNARVIKAVAWQNCCTNISAPFRENRRLE